MGKNKLNVTLSDRDKMLIWLVASVAIIICAYYLGYTKLNDDLTKCEAKYKTAAAKLEDLKAKSAKEEDYKKDTVIYGNRFNQIVSGYENGASQDHSILFLRDVEKTTGSWIKSTTFSTTTPIYTFGAIGSSNPETAGTRAYTSDMIGYKTTLTLSYEALYSDWKDFVEYLNNYYSKNTIDNISMTYNNGSDIVSGTMTLSSYCITGSNRNFKLPVHDFDKRKDDEKKNIFFSTTFFPTIIGKDDKEGNYILSDYDYYMLLNAATSDMDACIIGKKDDVSGDSILSSNENIAQPITINVWGKGGVYYINYKLGNQSYPALNYGAGSNFTAGDTIDLLIMSSSRYTSSDKSGADITIVNESDMDVNVKIVNDDVANPRVNIVSETGYINIYR